MSEITTEQHLKLLNEKMNFLIGGVLGTPFKAPETMSLDELKEQTAMIQSETEDIENDFAYDEEVILEEMYNAEKRVVIADKLFSDEELDEDEILYIEKFYQKFLDYYTFGFEDENAENDTKVFKKLEEIMNKRGVFNG